MKVRVSWTHDALPFNEQMDLASVDLKSPKNMALTVSIAWNNFLV